MWIHDACFFFLIHTSYCENLTYDSVGILIYTIYYLPRSTSSVAAVYYVKIIWLGTCSLKTNDAHLSRIDDVLILLMVSVFIAYTVA